MPKRPQSGRNRDARYAYAREGDDEHLDYRTDAPGSRKREKESDQDKKDESFAPGGSAARMGAMPMGAMLGGGSDASVKEKVSSGAPIVENELGSSGGVNEYNLVGDTEMPAMSSEPTLNTNNPASGGSLFDDTDSSDLNGVGGVGDIGAVENVPAVDMSPSSTTQSGPSTLSGDRENNGQDSISGVSTTNPQSSVPVDAESPKNIEIDGQTGADGIVADNAAIAVTPIQDHNNNQEETVIDLRRLLVSLGFLDGDADLIVRVISDGVITAAELEQIKRIKYKGIPENLLGDVELETIEGVVAPNVENEALHINETPSTVVNDSGHNNNIDIPVKVTETQNQAIGRIEIDNQRQTPPPRVKVTLDENGNIHIERMDDSGHTTSSIDVNNDNSIEVNSYEPQPEDPIDADGIQAQGQSGESYSHPKDSHHDGEVYSERELNKSGTNELDDADASYEKNAETRADSGTNNKGATENKRPDSVAYNNGIDTPIKSKEAQSNAKEYSTEDAAESSGVIPVIPVVVPPDSKKQQNDSSTNPDEKNSQYKDSNQTIENDQNNKNGNNGQHSANGNNNHVSTSKNSTGFEYLSTEYFAEAEKAAKLVAEAVRDLRTKIQMADYAASQKWLGKGHQQFKNLAYTVEIQLRDISEEFWSFYEDLTDAHSSYLEADEAAATSVNAIKDGK